MAWSKEDKKRFRLALQYVYRDYDALEIFVADELGWRLPSIAARGQDLNKVAFALINQAEAKGELDELYQAFRLENPGSSFQVLPKAEKKRKRPQWTQPQPTSPSPLSRGDFLKYGGAGIVGVVATLLFGPVLRESREDGPSQTSEPPQDLQGESFTFETASVTPDGQVTKQQGEGRRQIFDLGGTPLEMVWVPAGGFLMGSPDEEEGRVASESPQHRVTFAQGFWMARYPVTQAQWRWMAGLNSIDRELDAEPSFLEGDSRPVEQASWDDAQEFCNRLSQELSHDFQLPSEAQWEYACRAGTTTPFAFGETLTTDLANYDGKGAYGDGPKGRDLGQTTDVGQYPANDWGLHDMHGNVWEWCEDTWHVDYSGAPTDGSSRVGDSSTSYVVRGGSWIFEPGICRSAYRSFIPRGGRSNFIGFRVVCFPRVGP